MAKSARKKPWIIYGVYVADVLQYVGITTNMDRRHKQHSSLNFPDQNITTRELARATGRPAAERLEAKMIGKHRPPRNTRHNPSRRPVIGYVEAETRSWGGEPGTVRMRIKEGMMLPDVARQEWFHGEGTMPDRARRMGWSLGRAYEVFGPLPRTP